MTIQKNDLKLKIYLEHPDAKMPEVAYNGTSACFDLKAIKTVKIPKLDSAIIPVGLRMIIPKGWYVEFATRSGMGISKDLRVHPGIIDAGYKGELSVKVYNLSRFHTHTIEEGKGVVQCKVHRIPNIEFIKITKEEFEGTSTDRGSNGFGSSDNEKLVKKKKSSKMDNGFDGGGFVNSLKSKCFDETLIGDENEIIHPDKWDLPPFQKTGIEQQLHEHTKITQKYILDNHIKKNEILFLSNCASRKPYSTAKSISGTLKYLAEHRESFDVAVISSLGIIPIEFEKYYPYAHYAYDNEVHGDEKAKFIEIISDRVYTFLKKHKYKYVVSIFRNYSKGRQSVKRAIKNLKIDGQEIKYYDLPSLETIKTLNMLQLRTFQTTNIPSKDELKDVIGKLKNGIEVPEITGATKEEYVEVNKVFKKGNKSE